MCGRFVQAQPLHELSTFLSAAVDEATNTLPPRFNIAPSAIVTALTDLDDTRRLVPHIWGLIPSWAKDPAIGLKLSNARAETVWEKPSFRSSIRSSRVVVPIDGFYEWSPAQAGGPRGINGKPLKEPHYFTRRDGSPLLLAAISSTWRNPLEPADERRTVCLLTTGANATMAPIHHRMPVILERNELEHWLTASSEDAQDELDYLLRPCTENVLQERTVSTEVNNARNEGAHLLAEVDDTPTTLF